jgi:exopolysaccharide production protein ExoZ
MWLQAYPPFGTLWVGRAGVDVFFVISGFIMFHTTRNLDRTTLQFWTDRIIRIGPVYWIATLPVIVLFLLGLPDGGVVAVTPEAVLQDVLFIPHIRGDGDVHPLLNVGWTLTYEMFFYALFGATFFLRSQVKSLIALTSLFIGGYVLELLFPSLPHALAWYFQPITLEFAAGGLLALLYRRAQSLPKTIAQIAGLAMMVGGVIALFVAAAWGGEPMGEPTAFRTLMYGPPAVAIVGGALLLEKAGFVFSSRTLLRLGDASYSIYLAHTLVLVYVALAYKTWFLDSKGATAIAAVLAIALATLVGLLMHHRLEKPLTAWLKTLMRRRAHDRLTPLPGFGR